MTVSLRPLAESDFPAMSGWLSDPRVLEWYHGRDDAFDVARVAEHYGPRMRGDEGFVARIVELDGRAVGYLQTYPVPDAGEYGLDGATGVWAADLFLGEPALWGRGIGVAALRLAVDDGFANRGATRFVIDPRVDNVRAVRAYEKAGFRKIRRLRAHELHEGERRDCWLMTRSRA